MNQNIQPDKNPLTKTKYCLLTNDVETTSIRLNQLNDETGERVLKEGMPLLLDIYKRYNIRSTFFFTGYIAQKYPDVVRMIIPFNHEVASHGYSHKLQNAFDVLSLKEQIEHLKKSKRILEDISGTEVISFRAPALRISKNTSLALCESGYRIDSSVASQRCDFFFSFGSFNKFKWLFTPRLPYETKLENIFQKGNGGVIEVPISATILPYIGTTMRIFPALSVLQRKLLNYENSVNSKPVVFLIHPNEFLNESDRKRNIERRTENYLSYLIRDLIRSKLKAKNLGIKAADLYGDQIIYFQKHSYEFPTVKDYCAKLGLLK